MAKKSLQLTKAHVNNSGTANVAPSIFATELSVNVCLSLIANAQLTG